MTTSKGQPLFSLARSAALPVADTTADAGVSSIEPPPPRIRTSLVVRLFFPPNHHHQPFSPLLEFSFERPRLVIRCRARQHSSSRI
ncbi:hypothetical protein FKP32DRAFT_1218614 [Trametes sanguinea]|nr:hypothetical protein FKP32DRAFT_1218614 [Trametes sanguinea]